MNFLTNCVFLDEPDFDITMKRSRAWSKKGTRAIVTRPTTRANTMSILGAISAAGLTTVGVKKPRPANKLRNCNRSLYSHGKCTHSHARKHKEVYRGYKLLGSGKVIKGSNKTKEYFLRLNFI